MRAITNMAKKPVRLTAIKLPAEAAGAGVEVLTAPPAAWAWPCTPPSTTNPGRFDGAAAANCWKAARVLFD